MNWLKYRQIYFSISLVVLGVGIWSLLTNKLDLGVDFTGGSQVTWQNQEGLKSALESQFTDSSVREVENSLILSTKPLTQSDLNAAIDKLKEQGQEAKVLEFVTVGPSAGSLLVRQTLTAAAIAMTVILFYISNAFKSAKYGLAAILAMLHDTLVLLGSFSLLGIIGVKVDLLFVTALLTTLSFSVHDTIVLFDRVRELRRKQSGVGFDNTANQAITDTMIRSINNSMTIIFMLLALVLLGGESIRWFAVALLIGAITGTYSSPFVAIPLLSVFENFGRKN